MREFVRQIPSRNQLKDIRKIVLARTDRIGDAVITSSCFQPIRDTLPEVELYLLIRSAIEPLFHSHPLLTGIISTENSDFGGPGQPRLARKIQSLEPDCIVHFHDDGAVAAAAVEAQIPVRIGFTGGTDSRLLTHTIPNRKREGLKHEAEYNFELLAPMGIDLPGSLKPWISPDPEARARIPNLLPWWPRDKPFAVFHLAAHGDKIRLPVPALCRLAQWLRQSRDFEIVVIGSESDDDDVDRFVETISRTGTVWNLSGQTGLAEAAWILQRARILIARDSGPAHAAAAMGCPTLAVMGLHKMRSNLERWKPLGNNVKAIQIQLKPRTFETARRFQKRYFNSLSEEELRREACSLLA